MYDKKPQSNIKYNSIWHAGKVLAELWPCHGRSYNKSTTTNLLNQDIFEISLESLDIEKMPGKENKDKLGQEQLYDLLMSREVSWQAILLDLIHSEQLDPWDIDLVILSQKYIEKIQELQEANFIISSKVLLAASILLRAKSYILHSQIKSIDEILFDKAKKKDETASLISIFDFADEDYPDIMPKTPLPRFKKITLNELMSALDRAMKTEHRRIKRELFFKRAEGILGMAVFNKPMIDIKRKIGEVLEKIMNFFKKNPQQKLTFSMIAGQTRDEKIATFVPLLHLDHQNKIWLEQEVPFGEIEISLKRKDVPIEISKEYSNEFKESSNTKSSTEFSEYSGETQITEQK